MSGTSDYDKLVLQLKYNGQLIVVDCLSCDNSISDLKGELFKITGVLPINQKILGLRTINNTPVSDFTTLSCLVLKPGMKLMLIGSTQEDILKVNNTEDTSDVVDDFEFKEEDTQLHSVPENIKKVTRRCEAYRPRKLSEFRDGKKLLVLDLDYTIFGKF
ncbi:Ubiquitin-like domain-containing CTD phosphatase 1 [Schistosoma japonicum]|nr:Ubiquitin-like domain-containing CTD phosphatase 1 [Schistosoma japonicum]KAH8869740.1 Ubiquitin-like domain-containing CTD phosphatase 1 [Schistosoma japonicum]